MKARLGLTLRRALLLPLTAPLTCVLPRPLPTLAGWRLRVCGLPNAGHGEPIVVTLDELIDAITETWMAATSDAPSDADPEALAEHRQLCRNEVEVFLGVLSVQPEAIRAEIARQLLEAEEGTQAPPEPR